MKDNTNGGPWDEGITEGFTIEMMWRPVSFDRMQNAMRTFVHDETSVSGYLYHKLLGHDGEQQMIRVNLPRSIHAPNLPALNNSQSFAVRKALQSPLCLIQG